MVFAFCTTVKHDSCTVEPSILEGIQAYTSSSEDSEQAANEFTAGVKEGAKLSQSLKRQRVDKRNTCHRQLPSAADLLSQPRNALGIVTMLPTPALYLITTTAHQLFSINTLPIQITCKCNTFRTLLP